MTYEDLEKINKHINALKGITIEQYMKDLGFTSIQTIAESTMAPSVVFSKGNGEYVEISSYEHFLEYDRKVVRQFREKKLKRIIK